jgi:hypothetical protein
MEIRQKYAGSEISFSDITALFLRSFDQYMKKAGSGINTRSFVIKLNYFLSMKKLNEINIIHRLYNVLCG